MVVLLRQVRSGTLRAAAAPSILNESIDPHRSVHCMVGRVVDGDSGRPGGVDGMAAPPRRALPRLTCDTGPRLCNHPLSWLSRHPISPASTHDLTATD